MHLTETCPWPGWKFMSFFLITGLLVKIALSGIYLAPPGVHLWLGPGVSEAATQAVAAPQTSSNLPRLFSLIHKERQSLQAREAAVTAKEEHLSLLKKEVEERLQELKALQITLLESIEAENRIKGDHNRHLVATLTAMPPDRAGKLLEKMDEDVAVQLLRNLKGKEAGVILAVLAPDKAARLSQMLLQ